MIAVDFDVGCFGNSRTVRFSAKVEDARVIYQVKDPWHKQEYTCVKLLPDHFVHTDVAKWLFSVGAGAVYGGADHQRVVIRNACRRVLAKTLAVRVYRPMWEYIKATADPYIYHVQKRVMAVLGYSTSFNPFMIPAIYKTYWASDALRMNSAIYWMVSNGMGRNASISYEDYVMRNISDWQNDFIGSFDSSAKRWVMSNFPRATLHAVTQFRSINIRTRIRWWVRLELMCSCTHIDWVDAIDRMSEDDIKTIILTMADRMGMRLRDWRQRRVISSVLENIAHHAYASLDVFGENGGDMVRAILAVDEVMMHPRGGDGLDFVKEMPRSTVYPAAPFKFPENWVQIRNYKDLQEEGKEMHHCVGGYHNVCATGKYFVFSVREGEQRVTVGVTNGVVEQVQAFGDRYIPLCDAAFLAWLRINKKFRPVLMGHELIESLRDLKFSSQK